MSKTHAKFGSPSGLSALEKCPGKIAYTKDMPDLPESEYAKEGTEFHAHMETACSTIFDPLHLAEEFKVISTVDWMEEYVCSSIEELKELRSSFIDKHTNVKSHFELKIAVNDDIYGTADVVFVGKSNKTGKTDIVVLDWKAGRGVRVTAEENLQGIAYGLGAINTLDILNVGTCMIIIAQVRLEDGWTRFSFKGEDIKKYEDKITSIVGRAKDIYDGKYSIEDNLHAGSHCRFCKANGKCVAQKRQLLDGLQDAEELPLTERVKELTLDEQVAIFLKKKAIESLLDAVASNLSKAFQAGITHDALKLIQTKGSRRWKDKNKVGDILQERGIDDPYSHKVIGIVEAEKLLGKGVIDDLVEQGEGKLELVRAEDKREAILIGKLEELE
jgi:hypothetical protein